MAILDGLTVAVRATDTLSMGVVGLFTVMLNSYKFSSIRCGDFSRAQAYIWKVEILKKRGNAAGRTFCAASNVICCA
jgi:hypothetical protein